MIENKRIIVGPYIFMERKGPLHAYRFEFIVCPFEAFSLA